MVYNGKYPENYNIVDNITRSQEHLNNNVKKKKLQTGKVQEVKIKIFIKSKH